MLRIRHVLLIGTIAMLGSLTAAASADAVATRAEFVTQAEPHCASANRDIAKLNKRFRALEKRGRTEAAGHVLEKTGPRLARSVAQVRAIVPPPGDEQIVDSWLALIQRVARNNRRVGRAHARGDLALEDRLGTQTDLLRIKAHDLVFDWGFQACVGER